MVRFQSTLVAKKTALTIWGPATITNASGRTVSRLVIGVSAHL
jgi:hypothetical protein